MAGIYVGSPTAVQAPGVAPSMTVYPTQSIPSDGDALNVASIAQALKVLNDNVAYLLDRQRDMIFGPGTDGAQTTAGLLSSYVYADTWTLTSGSLFTAGWPVIARTSITLSNCGVNGVAVSATGPAISGYGSGAWGPHGSIGLAAGTTNSPQYALAQVYGLGGNGGTGGGAVSVSSVVSPGNQYKSFPYRYVSGNAFSAVTVTSGSQGTQVNNVSTLDALRGGAAGTAGAGDSVHSFNGGGPGAGGALVVLMAPTINLTNVVFASNGATGGAGQTGASSTACGGGGGGGGAFLFICRTLTVSANSYIATPGSGGGGPGTAGAAGVAGNTTPFVVTVP